MSEVMTFARSIASSRFREVGGSAFGRVWVRPRSHCWQCHETPQCGNLPVGEGWFWRGSLFWRGSQVLARPQNLARIYVWRGSPRVPLHKFGLRGVRCFSKIEKCQKKIRESLVTPGSGWGGVEKQLISWLKRANQFIPVNPVLDVASVF